MWLSGRQSDTAWADTKALDLLLDGHIRENLNRHPSQSGKVAFGDTKCSPRIAVRRIGNNVGKN
jgi:hypothetical protein